MVSGEENAKVAELVTMVTCEAGGLVPILTSIAAFTGTWSGKRYCRNDPWQ